MYICFYLHTCFLEELQAVFKSNSRYAWRWPSSEPRGTLGCDNSVNWEIYFQAVINQVWRYTWMPWLCELGRHDWFSLEMYLEGVIV
jgi:hypothetical protein